MNSKLSAPDPVRFAIQQAASDNRPIEASSPEVSVIQVISTAMSRLDNDQQAVVMAYMLGKYPCFVIRGASS